MLTSGSIFRKLTMVLSFTLSAICCCAQDSLFTLNVEQLINLVKQYHPVVKQTNINKEKANADVLIARSAFDPVLSNYSASKTFNGVDYYNSFSPELKIPTWYGVEIYSGLENLTGSRLDPTHTTGESSYLGVSVPLAKNLVIDKRRAFLQQAKIFTQMAGTEQRKLVNDLLLNAIESYWQWVKEYQTYVVLKNTVIVNEKRFSLIKKAFTNGERPAIDTIEALAQLQSFIYEREAYWLDFQNAGLALSAYLWKSNNEPYVLPQSVIPYDTWDKEVNMNNLNISLTDLLNVADKTHPELQLYKYKLNVLGIDKKLKFQELLPKVEFRYNQLGKGYDLFKTASAGPLFDNNFQYGIKFEMPLRLSQGRGEYKKAKLKIEETNLDQQQKRLQIQLKIKSCFNEFLTLGNQIILQTNNLNNYQQLVKAEETRFSNGESSIFLINSRETKALETLEKLIDVKIKYYKTIYKLQWSAGLLQ